MQNDIDHSQNQIYILGKSCQEAVVGSSKRVNLLGKSDDLWAIKGYIILGEYRYIKSCIIDTRGCMDVIKADDLTAWDRDNTNVASTVYGELLDSLQ